MSPFYGDTLPLWKRTEKTWISLSLCGTWLYGVHGNGAKAMIGLDGLKVLFKP